MADKLTQEQAERLLRATSAKLMQQSEIEGLAPGFAVLAADIALVAQLLADHIEWGQEQ